MGIKLDTPVKVLIGITVGFLCGYAVNDLLEKPSIATTQEQYLDHACDIGALDKNSNASSRVLETSQTLANARTAPQAIAPAISSENEQPREQQDQIEGLQKSASTNVLDANEVERIKEEAVNAFMSGGNIKTIIATKEFSKLSIEDQKKVIDRTVQLVNDGSISADQIYR